MSMKKNFILSPGGTSLLTNGADPGTRSLINQYANVKGRKDVPEGDAQKLESRISEVHGKLMTENNLESVAKMSAELNAIIKFYEGQLEAHKGDYHRLLCTDTWLGEQTISLVAEWLESRNFIVEKKRQTDLQTKSLEAFQTALSDIVEWCEKELKDNKFEDNDLKNTRKNYHVVFNLTGGFKSVQGFLQTLATFYADETIYIFETGKELLRIPRLPVKMAYEDKVLDNIIIFRRLALGLSVDNTGNMPETLLMTVDGETILSPWGELVWKQTKERIYEKEVFLSLNLSHKLSFGDGFKKSVEKLGQNCEVLINKTIDQLVNFLETGENPNSLDFKAIKAKAKSVSTHEMDAWSGTSKRLYGHFDKDIFILDELSNHL